MAEITDIVAVSITVQDTTPAVANFGSMAIFAGDGPKPVGTWQGTYDSSPSGLSAMVTDGFSISGGAYTKAQAIVAQNPRTDKFKVYRRAVPNTHSMTLTFTKTTAGYVNSFELAAGAGTFGFTAISYTNGGAETVTTIATAIELLTEAVAGIASTSALGVITLTTDTAGVRMYVKNCKRDITVKDTSADAGIATDLAAAAVEDSDFFGFVIDGTGAAEITAAATWAESNARIFLGLSTDSDVVGSGSGDIASVIKAAGRHFASVVFSRDVAGAADASLMARQFSRDPGTSTWFGKALPGVTVDNLTATELSNARGKNAVTYNKVKGVSITYDGKASSGRFLDITHGSEWLKARIAEQVFTIIANTEKVDFTDRGIGLIEAAVRAQMSEAESKGFIAAGWTVTVPKAAAVSIVNKANRLLPDVKFNAKLAGAIHKAFLDGTIAV